MKATNQLKANSSYFKKWKQDVNNVKTKKKRRNKEIYFVKAKRKQMKEFNIHFYLISVTHL